MKLKIGQTVSVRVREEAYYSSYGGNPELFFEPGMLGTLVGYAPKVRTRGDFAVVDYLDASGKLQRVGVTDLTNLIRAQK